MYRRSPFSLQAPAAIIMVRPHHFAVNLETAEDNSYQSNDAIGSDCSANAYREITNAAEVLTEHGVNVHVFDDKSSATPDSVFPNNWISTHAGGQIALYPMKAQSRRKERRHDIVDMLKANYRVQDIFDLSGLEYDGLYLEGTGAMVLDHVARVAYAVESDRTNPIALERFCAHFNYEPIVFQAFDHQGKAIYHTNVLMCVATEFALIGLDMIADKARRNEVAERLESAGHEVIGLRDDQVASFAGNAIELQAKDKRILALSKTAFDALGHDQRAKIEQSAELVPIDIPTIELSGGSVRCTIAGIHLAARKAEEKPLVA